MEAILKFLSSPHVLALLVSLFLFFITLILVGKQVIGFLMTLLLLLFTLLSGLTIANQDLIRDYIRGGPEASAYETAHSAQQFRKKLLDGFNEVKGALQTQSAKIDGLSKEIETLSAELKKSEENT